MNQRPIILPMLASDLDVVGQIAQACFPVPWTRDEFEKELSRPYAQLRVLRPALGARICAFMNFWCIGDEVQLMNVATLPGDRQKGYGRALMAELVQTARERHASLVTLEVRRSNIPARSLYRAFGFTDQGIRQRYYSDNGEDAVVMHLQLAQRL